MQSLSTSQYTRGEEIQGLGRFLLLPKKESLFLFVRRGKRLQRRQYSPRAVAPTRKSLIKGRARPILCCVSQQENTIGYGDRWDSYDELGVCQTGLSCQRW